ncbi:hypothetical protein HanXRQr2_Chr08g0354971 [Helianthus annuus]|uniref:Uncharacterized protein n=1 Tax=Helianthus annuus TaxID=4232 RepID=A0A251U8W3_HELAN|nr:hypothetical protein HanXRQr2_Chr08g0354971 [Helianthus annuus]KAJ0539993.1 hypothetical protein HanHA300_Chr08g0293081 [Helianthus annuus]KAJ0548360.1 hypothetical protein HanIR_Chr08g0382901 [Helianthus annuus]KAJ0554728.1 hypothetical protein HanHA89_Chr08g0311511 [Helianthus annuus]KAJ0720295.1 hypothetical protein HanLR1_Chr08g0291851 [Helianthus annuus]
MYQDFQSPKCSSRQVSVARLGRQHGKQVEMVTNFLRAKVSDSESLLSMCIYIILIFMDVGKLCKVV